MRRIAAILVMAVCGACGGDNPAEPSGSGGGGGGAPASGSPGSVTVSIDGASISYEIISNIYHATDTTKWVSVSLSRRDGSTHFAFGFPAAPGTYPCCQPPVNSYAQAAYIFQAASWSNSLPPGANDGGAITVTSGNVTSATGTFDFKLRPVTGGAAGEKRAIGSFSVRYDCNSTPALGTTDCTR